jgi:hypothetical protein
MRRGKRPSQVLGRVEATSRLRSELAAMVTKLGCSKFLRRLEVDAARTTPL